jgi:outer membrane protein OmpA-like peptidoglycan-associated protein
LASKEINIRIDVDISGQPAGRLPPPVWAAEADDSAILVQLTRRPGRKFARRYTFQEVATEPEVREAMPAVEIDTVTFGFNEDWVREEQLDNLDRIGAILEEILAAHPHEVFMIEGHTDAVGTDEYNLDLSRRRAVAIKEALTQYYEIRPENLETIGYGEEYLKIRTEDPEEENRRISIRRITPAVGALE